ncbi:hypothetical protein LX15_004446 [Streptoalloteichus tenebrarius]|uniref:Intracellular septation protein A n=1 Tax=Streptoalloteichus tenebrarius (strain ATCC 17920 / DSM 40477 / JCM 4838 / CBS 697.72 / NBRC 16177 / NCIMB 11028 / NRRL B-12390 / A12253. 1 / ISP 5477) TaxID=1933 RepID=A0ABT1HYX6_STRSD|nr:DUF3159 domain-containing protein [Streptoalloteichus tenebrarius]MCP2260726.1 hypothetical protein [Streptoalloteichus tenebrarius]BFF03740.1 hypothetical protein GCM10020241_54150 [Streptoalloteichus tenebrarius]
MTDNLDRHRQHAPAAPAAGRGDQPPGALGMFLTLVYDVGLAVAAYYGFRLLGFDQHISLLAGTVASGLRVLYVAVRKRNFDVFAGFLLVVFGVGLVLSFVTGDEKFLLLKDSFATAVAGLLFLGSCFVGRPLTFHAAKRLRASTPDEAAAWDARYARERDFRRTFLVLSAGWGAGLLAEAVVRVPLIYVLSTDVMAGLSQVLFIATMALLFVWNMGYIRHVVRRMQASQAPAQPVHH